ncbi:MAG TPA: hypothetical protein VD735_00435, partial [Candidatus Saccharimonadales bacterium]|nr:hypothetical protein [Candidatus Saccharimonadales bacterium]
MTSFEAAAQHITRFDTAPPAQVPLSPAETSTRDGNKWWQRTAVVGALVVGAFGVEAATDAVSSQAAAPSCYGDYCSGQYANETGCDQDAETIT